MNSASHRVPRPLLGAETGDRARHRQHLAAELLRVVRGDAGGSPLQLPQAGYRVDALCSLDPAAASTQASKTACRAGWVAQGCTIVADVGNHTTDLDGGNAGRPLLLPNYGFLD